MSRILRQSSDIHREKLTPGDEIYFHGMSAAFIVVGGPQNYYLTYKEGLSDLIFSKLSVNKHDFCRNVYGYLKSESEIFPSAKSLEDLTRLCLKLYSLTEVPGKSTMDAPEALSHATLAGLSGSAIRVTRDGKITEVILLKLDDKIEFSCQPGRIYSVGTCTREFYLTTGGDNDAIFRELGIDKNEICRKFYKDHNLSGQFPQAATLIELTNLTRELVRLSYQKTNPGHDSQFTITQQPTQHEHREHRGNALKVQRHYPQIRRSEAIRGSSVSGRPRKTSVERGHLGYTAVIV
jgi:hypothetical protein